MVRGLLAGLWRAAGDRLAVWRLRRAVQSWKARSYDDCAETVAGLRRALATQQRAQQDLVEQLAARAEEAARLRAEYAALQARAAQSDAARSEAERLALFRGLQPVLVQLPTLRAAVERGADVSARDVLEVLSPLGEFASDLGVECIGEAGQETRYEPRLHRAVGRGAARVAAGDAVRVRYVGFRLGDEVLAKAEVTALSGADRAGDPLRAER